MKNRPLFFFLSFVFFQPLSAQVSIGLKSGVFMSKLDDTGYDYRSKFLLSNESNLFLRLTVRERLFAQLEFDYSGKGGDLDIRPSTDNTLRIRGHQFELPFLLGFKLPVKGLDVYGNAGMYAGRKVATHILETPPIANHRFVSEKKDKGYLFGLGAMKKINKVSVLFEARYRCSIADRFGRLMRFSPSGDFQFGTDYHRNRGISLLLGLSCDL
jgi:hypothetical protein